MNACDLEWLGHVKGDVATVLEFERADRVVRALTIVRYDLPVGCCASCEPETRPLIALEDHDAQGLTPSYKSMSGVSSPRPSFGNDADREVN